LSVIKVLLDDAGVIGGAVDVRKVVSSYTPMRIPP
jgi:hypothetical protein